MVTILSPHLDDAAYSLTLMLRRLASKERHIEIVNCFTQSSYSVQGGETTSGTVSRHRLYEDKAFLQCVGKSVHARYLELPDTSLRPKYSDLGDAFHSRALDEAERNVLVRLVALLRSLPSSGAAGGPVVVPIAYGNHIDHRLVRAAAEELYEAERLIYYEDMPYSAKAARRKIRQRLDRSHCEAMLCVADAESLRFKDMAIACYSSQLTPEHRELIGQRAAQLGGERVWLSTPSYGALWA